MWERRGSQPWFLDFSMPQVVVVTGAGAGVGRATAEEFAGQGYDVGLFLRDPDRLERTNTELRRHGVRGPTGSQA
jgi:NADP-dependent 3-hydroxy acid dehydrogenase YdfG